MRLISWNVNGRYGPALERQVEVVRQADPTVVCLQEVRAESVDVWSAALQREGLNVETSQQLVGERTYFLLLAHRGDRIERRPARTFAVPYPELVLALVITLNDTTIEVVNTHVPNGSANGWRKVEHLDALFGYFARTHTAGRLRVLCGDFNCPRAEQDGRVFTWAERDDGRLVPDRGLRWDTAERGAILGLSAFDMHDVYRAEHPLTCASREERGSHVTRGSSVERRYDHVFASAGLQPWSFAYLHDVRTGSAALSDHSAALVEFQRLDVNVARRASYDQSIAVALELVAQRIERDVARPGLREEMIEVVMQDAWREVTDGGEIGRRASLPVPDWDPQPAHTDLAGVLPGEVFPGFVAEVKIDNLDQTLWDLFKLLSVARGAPSIARCYLIVAGYPSRWTNVEVAEIYDPETCSSVWEAREMFARWQKAWRDLLKGGRARPRAVDAQVRITPIWRGAINAFAYDNYELRCVAVESLPAAGSLAFAGDWPLRIEGGAT